MFKKILTIAIGGLLIQAVCVQSVSAASKAEKQAQLAQKVKAGILKLGSGNEARVAIKLRDKTKVAGYISEATESSFVVTDPKTQATATVSYGDVTQVKGHNLGTGAKVAIGIGIGVGVTLLVIWLIIQNYSD